MQCVRCCQFSGCVIQCREHPLDTTFVASQTVSSSAASDVSSGAESDASMPNGSDSDAPTRLARLRVPSAFSHFISCSLVGLHCLIRLLAVRVSCVGMRAGILALVCLLTLLACFGVITTSVFDQLLNADCL